MPGRFLEIPVFLGDYFIIPHPVHCVQKKTTTYVFDYISGVSWWIFLLFALLEREMNTLQFTYLLTYCIDDIITALPCTPQMFAL